MVDVSVIIPFRGSDVELASCLLSLGRQVGDAGQVQVVIVCDGYDVHRQALEQRFPWAVFLQQAHKGSYAARNLGVEYATGEVLVFVDSDCVPSSDWLSQGMTALSRLPGKASGFIGGRVEFSFEDQKAPTLAEYYDSITFMQQEFLVNQRGFSATANMFVRRDVFLDIGPFDESLHSGGDGDWGTRAIAHGYVGVYAAEVVVRHRARRTLKELRRKWIRIMRGFSGIKVKQGRNSIYRLPFKPFPSNYHRHQVLSASEYRISLVFLTLYFFLLREYWRLKLIAIDTVNGWAGSDEVEQS